MRQALKYFCIVLFLVFIGYTVSSPPDPPRNVEVHRQNRRFAVTWDVPAHAYGNLTRYVVTSILLPEGNRTYLRLPPTSPIAFISYANHLGKLYSIQVQAENTDGLGYPSKASFIRAPCGFKVFISPGLTETISSPNYPWSYEPGVLCEWDIQTNSTHVLSLEFETIDFGENEHCKAAGLYVTVGQSVRNFCDPHKSVTLTESYAKMTFRTKSVGRGKGFRMNIKTRVKSPGPPSNVTVKSTKSSIHVNWQPPTGNLLPVTSYKLEYTFLPSIRRVIFLPPHMLWFSINTKGFEGRMISLQIKAFIKDLEGEPAGPIYARANCITEINISDIGQIYNITSPNYPSPYPPGVVCNWRIRNPYSYRVVLNVKWMDIQRTLLCNGDFVSFSVNGNAHECGHVKDHIIKTRNTFIFITFKSDFDVQRSGFYVQVFTIYDKTSAVITTTSHTEQTSIMPSHHVSTTIDNNTPLNITDSTISTTSFYSYPSQTIVSSFPENISKIFSTIYSTPPRLMSNSIGTSSDQTMTSSSVVSTLTHISTANTNSGKHIQTTTISPSGYATSLEPAYSSRITSSKRSSTTSFRIALSTIQAPHPTIKAYEPSIKKHFYEPNLGDVTFPLHLVFGLRQRDPTVRAGSLPVNKSILSRSLQNIFNKSGLYSGLFIDRLRLRKSIIVAEVTVNFNVKAVLQRQKTDKAFNLVTYVNKTFLEHISDAPIDSSLWKYDDESIDDFRNSSIFKEQEIKSKCDYVTTCSANYFCVERSTSTCGILCCSFDIAKCSNNCSVINMMSCLINDSQQYVPDEVTINNYDIIIIALSVSVVCIVAAVVCVVLRFRYAAKKRSIRVQNAQNNIELHDILQSNFIGGKNIEFTAFSRHRSSRRQDGKLQVWSLPSRNILNKYKVPGLPNGQNNGSSSGSEEVMPANGHPNTSLKRQHSF